MSTLPTIDAGTLGWVKSEIEDTSAQARALLEKFEADASDPSTLRLCATHLHQVYGTLTMVELDGAAQLVQECERLAQALADGGLEWRADAGGALKRAIDDLSSYLEGLQSTPVPSPLQLVGSINRIRDVRGEAPVSELELFSPDLSARPPEATAQSRITAALFIKLADDLRIRFERALLSALRDPTDPAPFKEFSRVFRNLVSIDRRGSLRQLWWIGAGLSEALLDGSVALDDDVRPVLARINEQLKRLKDKNQGAGRRAPPDELIKRALLILAHCDSDDSTIKSIREAFSLDEWVAGGNGLALPDIETLGAALARFSKEAEADLELAQNLLARYFSPQGGQSETLDKLSACLASLKATAERNEIDVFSRLIDALASVVESIKDGSTSNTERASLQMAGALLFIQDSGGDVRPGPEWKAQAESTISALDAEADAGTADEAPPAQASPGSAVPGDHATRAAASEVRGELQYVEHALEQVAGNEAPVSRLRSVEPHLKRVEGTLEILEQGDAAALTEKLRAAIRTVVEGDAASPRRLDTLAMAVGTLGVCADELSAGNSLARMTSTIERAMVELDHAVAGDDSASRPVHLELVHSIESAPDPDDGEEGANLPPRESDDGALALDESFESLELEFDDGIGDSATDRQGHSAPPVAHVDEAASVQDELVGIFFEEADEIESSIEQGKAAWRLDPGNEETLGDLRRCFHTLKGSGRFAGTASIAELSWIVEDLLNAVIEKEVPPSAKIHDFVDEAHESLSALIARRDTGDDLDLQPWRNRADALKEAGAGDASDAVARGLGDELLELETAHRRAAPPAEKAPPVNDVFFSELDGHIRVIADSVEEARRRFPNWEISEPLLRTSHTLRGIFRSVGLQAPARMADALDDLLGYKKRGTIPLQEVDLVLIDQSGRLMRFASHKLDGELALTPDLAMQFDELASALAQRLRYLETGNRQSDSAPPAAEPDAEDTAPLTVSGENEELLEAFREEAQEILARLDQQVARWRGGAPAEQALSAMRRELHTFKGGARAVGLTTLGDLAHNTETLLENDRLATTAPGPVADLVAEMHDLAAVAIGSPERAFGASLEDLNRRVLAMDAEGVAGGVSTELSLEDDQDDTGPADTLDLVAAISPTPRSSEEPPAPLPSVMAGGESRAVRVRTEVLDELVSFAGEVSILRSRLQQQIAMVKSNIGELGETVRLFRDQLRDLEIESEAQMLATNERIREEGSMANFDPLELDRFSRLQTISRQLGESLGALVAIQAGISEFAGDADNTLQQQRHLSDSLQEGLLRTRMISFVALVPRLRHLARQTAAELDREVSLKVSGEQVEVDRKVLDQMSSSFEHMIRNAVSHGIESPEVRRAADKPLEGTISFTVEQEGNDIVIHVADDGGGIDLEAIASRARSLGLLGPDRALGDDDLMRVLATPGLSTADAVTQVSGRGVGMDVVSEMVRQLGGSIAVETERGKGTTFILRLPVTLAVSHALLVYAGEQMFAVPARLIVSVLRIRRPDLADGDGDVDGYADFNDRRIPVLNLARRLGLPFRETEDGVANIVVVRAGLREIGLWVESISDSREVVVKPLGKLLQSIPGIGAVTLLGDGSIVLILDVPDLWQSRRLRVTTDTYAVATSTTDNVTVMVVDDSMTVRNVMGRDLQNNGFEVILAKDGVDAIEQLRHTVPDIMLVDLEMPRMDGFELTRRVRVDDNLREVPILVITSRAGSRHRDQAMQLGANGYMSKPYRLDDLVRSIHSLTDEDAGGSDAADSVETLH